jgi:hypothetical protein
VSGFIHIIFRVKEIIIMKQASAAAAVSGRETSLGSVIGLAKKVVTNAASDWNLSPKTIAVICVAPFVVALAGATTALIGKELYKWFTQEDGFAESMQVLFYSGALVLSIIVTRRLWRGGERGIAILYVALCFGLFFLIGEELSWGQRIFGWGTVDSFAAINKQEETNLHNVYGVGSTFKWIQLLVGAYGTILPLVILLWSAPVRFQKMISMTVPHYTLIPYFALLFVWRVYRNLVEEPARFYFAISEYNEVMELVLSMGIFLFMVFQLRRLKSEKDSKLSVPATGAD